MLHDTTPLWYELTIICLFTLAPAVVLSCVALEMRTTNKLAVTTAAIFAICFVFGTGFTLYEDAAEKHTRSMAALMFQELNMVFELQHYDHRTQQLQTLGAFSFTECEGRKRRLEMAATSENWRKGLSCELKSLGAL